MTPESQQDQSAVPPSMRGLALFRIGLGAFAWLAPRTMNRIFGVPRADDSPGGATAIDLAALGNSD